MIQLFLVTVFSVFMFFHGNAQKFQSDAILGQWLTSKGECKVEVFKKGNLYYGKIVWLKEPNDENGKPVKDCKNPDPKLRIRPLLGMTIMFDFQFDGNDRWTNGTIYNADNGKTYKALIKMESADVIYLRGYFGMPALGMDTKWTRLK